MKKTFILTRVPIVVILALSLFLIACTQQQKATTGGAFIGGTSGLQATFEPISIKEDGIYTIFDSENFPLDVILKNKGEQTVSLSQATLRLLGPAPQDFEGIPSWTIKNNGNIEKISEFNPEGGEESLGFTGTGRAKYKSKITGFTDINWNLEYTYDYKTYLIINDVCFKGDITNTKVCDIKGSRIYSVSGAPITVTSVSEESGGKGIIVLRIMIKNAGTGDSSIPGKDFDTRFNQLGFTVDEPDKWECKSGGRSNEARLSDDGTAEVQCRLKSALKEDDLYTRTVKLTLDYSYREIIQEKLRIKESVK